MAAAVSQPPLPLPQQTHLMEEEHLKHFQEYLDNDSGPHKQRIVEMLQRNGHRLIVDLNHLRTYSLEYWQKVINEPMEYLSLFEKALKTIVDSLAINKEQQLQRDDEYYIGFEGAVPHREVNPRTLLASEHMGKMVVLEGIVTRCSLLRPKVRKSVHYCETTKLFHAMEYRDATMVANDVVVTSTYPSTDKDGNRLETEFGFCRYVDFQTVSIQEMPEKAPPGQLPRSVDIVLNADLVDRVKPGDRVRFFGVYRAMGGVNAGSTNALFKTLLIANNIQEMTKTVYQRPLSDGDIENIKKIGKRKNVVELLAKSLAPSIYGHDLIKKAILLQLLGGIEKNLVNGTHIRGDINILMVGDPSTAKSQLLRFVLKMAPLAIATTGRGSSGVGLTAAIVSDKDTGERRLEAGAMVLADRGIVCIDEFDKMSDIDRVAIHEVMEQQTVTIAKAGIHTSLNARCSVIAAANPMYGQYDNSISPAANTALPDSLMSRFDLVFVVLDQVNASNDRLISSHVLRMHRYIPAGLEEGEPIEDLLTALSMKESNAGGQQEDAADDEGPFEKNHPLLANGERRNVSKIVRVEFLKKYIHYAKSRIQPEITDEASEVIVEKYGQFRQKASELGQEKRSKVFPVTPRSLEALIRLATAHAKARLSATVDKEDAEVAAELMNYSIFREISKPGEEPKPKKPRVSLAAPQIKRADSDDDDSDDNAEVENDGGRPTASASRRTSTRVTKTPLKSLETDDEADNDSESGLKPRRKSSQPASRSQQQQQSYAGSSQTTTGDISQLIDQSSSLLLPSSSQPVTAAKRVRLNAARTKAFRSLLNSVRMQHCLNSSSLNVDVIKRECVEKFTDIEIDSALLDMQDLNQLMVDGGVVYFMN